MRGRIIRSSNGWIFVQLDKNNQICDLFTYDKSRPKEERIRERIRGRLFDMFHGRPLYTAWNDIVEEVSKDEK